MIEGCFIPEKKSRIRHEWNSNPLVVDGEVIIVLKALVLKEKFQLLLL